MNIYNKLLACGLAVLTATSAYAGDGKEQQRNVYEGLRGPGFDQKMKEGRDSANSPPAYRSEDKPIRSLRPESSRERDESGR